MMFCCAWRCPQMAEKQQILSEIMLKSLLQVLYLSRIKVYTLMWTANLWVTQYTIKVKHLELTKKWNMRKMSHVQKDFCNGNTIRCFKNLVKRSKTGRKKQWRRWSSEVSVGVERKTRKTKRRSRRRRGLLGLYTPYKTAGGNVSSLNSAQTCRNLWKSRQHAVNFFTLSWKN